MELKSANGAVKAANGTVKAANGVNGTSHHASDNGVMEDEKKMEEEEEEVKEIEIVWGNVIKFVILHSLALYGLTLLPGISTNMWIFLFLTYQFSGAGITAGAHRLWAHKSYSARLPLRIFLTVANSMAGQNSIYVWSRDHRTHHKYSETHGDPHNAKRGFFFAHMGWLLCRKHPKVTTAGKTIDLSDLEADPMVMFQHRHYVACMVTACFILPTIIPHILWGESLGTAYCMAVLRYVLVLHFTWLVNSAAHLFGGKPYDVTIGPAENSLVSALAMGEGHHNYHHVFPMDYSTSEWGYSLNVTKVFIDVMAWAGLAYNLKTTKPDTIVARAKRTGRIEQTKMWKYGKAQ